MCIHYWMIDSQNKGICKVCGEQKDFNPPHEKMSKPEIYLVRSLCTTNGYYLQGSLKIPDEQV